MVSLLLLYTFFRLRTAFQQVLILLSEWLGSLRFLKMVPLKKSVCLQTFLSNVVSLQNVRDFYCFKIQLLDGDHKELFPLNNIWLKCMAWSTSEMCAQYYQQLSQKILIYTSCTTKTNCNCVAFYNYHIEERLICSGILTF